MRILIVDDSVESREMLCDALVDLDVQLIECADGRSAIAEYELSHPDIVLMDIQMPVLDGISATQIIRKTNPHARIIIVSQFDEHAFRADAGQAGAERYFLKHEIMELLTYIKTQMSLN
jgi:CheY-like chemotaxis protein